jgi:hypothetical protein
MSPAQVKREWDKKMRNADGSVPGEPQRKPCVIYLSDAARAVISDERKAASAAGMSPLLTSRLIEDLLHQHAAAPLRDGRAGLSEKPLLEHLRLAELKVKEANARKAIYSTGDAKPNIRTIRRLVQVEMARPQPTLDELRELLLKMASHHRHGALIRLMNTLRPVLSERRPDNELLPRFRAVLNRYLVEFMTDTRESLEARHLW